jgi:shikimate kinase
MALYLIDGLPGTGKTTIGKILKSHGCKVYDGDQDKLAHWYSKDTGDVVPREKEERTPEFLKLNSRKLDPNAIKILSSQATTTDIFVTHDPHNLHEVTEFFDKQFALILSEPKRQKRLDERTNNGWGKLPHEREYDSKIALQAPKRYEHFGHIKLDASQNPEELAKRVLALVGTPQKNP